MKNRIVHFDIYAQDVERAKKFYSDVFGWTYAEWSFNGSPYWGVMTAEQGSTEPGINGGLMKRPGPDPVDGQAVTGFCCTVQVENIDETIAKIESAGGTLALAKMAIPGMAWQAYYKDTEGNVFGIHEANKDAQ